MTSANASIPKHNLNWLAVVGFLIGLTPSMAAYGRATMALTAIPALVMLFVGTARNGMAAKTLAAMSRNGVVRVIVSVGIAALVLGLHSQDPERSFTTGLRTIILALLGIYVCLVLDASRRSAHAAGWGVVAGALMAASYVLVSRHLLGGVTWPLASAGLDPQLIGNVFKAFSSVMSCLLIICLVLAWWSDCGKWQRCFALAAALLLACALFISDGVASRSAMMAVCGALVAVVLLLFLLWLPRRLRVAVFVLICLVIAGGLVAVFETLRAGIGASPFEPRLPLWMLDMHRQAIWGFAWQKALEAPLLGWGVDTINLVAGAKELVPGLNPAAEFIPSHPHNFLLEICAELGFPLALAVLGALLYSYVRLALLPAGVGLKHRLSAAALFGAFWTASLSNFSIWSYWWLTCYAILMAVLAIQFSENGSAAHMMGCRQNTQVDK